MYVFVPGEVYSFKFALQAPPLPQRAWFLRRFGLKTVVDFAYFGLNSVLVFERIRKFLDILVVSTLTK